MFLNLKIINYEQSTVDNLNKFVIYSISQTKNVDNLDGSPFTLWITYAM
ncbi:hypothetical protein WSSLDB02_00320 [Weissella soli]|nr:hypothetical protein WSO01_08370 [Weissella soli]GJM47475.1 hypothetical protein WSSLDB02_00320 [Weissella soli]